MSPAPAYDPIAAALAEDLGTGDVTSRYFVGVQNVRARVFAKEPCVAAGVEVAAEVFRRVDARLKVRVVHASGARLRRGAAVIEVAGAARSILTAERVALNFVQRLSGVATLTRLFVEAVHGTGARILDTRKTTPGLRVLEKAAVLAGGGTNHRMGLFDMAMVKDNHLAAGDRLATIQRGIDALHRERPGVRVEIEADTLAQVRAFLTLRGVDVVLLDNMPVAKLRRAVAMVKGRVKLEASGGVTLETVHAIAETGVDFISVGALTHSARAVDFSLEVA